MPLARTSEMVLKLAVERGRVDAAAVEAELGFTRIEAGSELRELASRGFLFEIPRPDRGAERSSSEPLYEFDAGQEADARAELF
jgi:hypothetical protein